MTTQNSHHEQSDADISVVECLPVSEPAADSATTTTSAEVAIQAGLSSAELATPLELRLETHSESPVLQEDEHHTVPESENLDIQAIHSPEAQVREETALTEFVADTLAETAIEPVSKSIVGDATEPVSKSVAEQTEEQVALPYTEVIPLMEEIDEVRPFTEFIKEFRQAEARFNASLQETQPEAYPLLLPTEANLTTFEVYTPVNEDLPTIDQSEQLSLESFVPAHTEEFNRTEVSLTDEGLVSMPGSDQKEVEEKETPVIAPAAPVERGVSPLLRPAQRLRLPRHSRHQREEPVVEVPAPAIEASLQPVPTAIPTPLPVEPVIAPEPARPARRYRFDRPTTSNGVLPAASTQLASRLEEKQDKETGSRPTPTLSFGRADVSERVTELQARSAASVTHVTESQIPRLPEAVTTEGTSLITPAATVENGRRRQHHERQKEQVTIIPPLVVENVALVAEVTAQLEEIAPEDLPPLEYAELQKAASPRRRRRHRAGASSSPSTAVVTEVPVVPPVVEPLPILPTSMVIPPRPTSVPSGNPTTNPYTIVSGYTVSQMNMGNEASGPFMGPEPSPARGSLLSRDGRSARAEVQRSPVYPTRTHEAAPSSASLNHVASVVVQAIQAQTDRMVTELRRTSQAPTNVSVTLPPFPSTERVGVFVDVANLLYSARTLRIAVDFGKLLDFLRGNRRLVRAHAYCPTSPQAGDEQMFLQAVKGLGYRITTKNYKTFSSGAKKADLDLDLCIDVVRLVDGKAVDCIVLVSGDSDFMPMLDYCSDHGVRVEVAAFDEAMSATLRQSCDLFVNLSMLDEILLVNLIQFCFS